jgi:hypothetical protein
MMPDQSYQVFQADRPKTDAERRAADTRLGETAAAAAHLTRKLSRPVRALRTLRGASVTGRASAPQDQPQPTPQRLPPAAGSADQRWRGGGRCPHFLMRPEAAQCAGHRRSSGTASENHRCLLARSNCEPKRGR